MQYSALVSEVMENCSVLIAKGDPFISMTDAAGVLSEFSAERRKKLELSDEESDAYKTRLRKGQRACAFQGHEDFGHTCPTSSVFFPSAFRELSKRRSRF